MMKEKVISIFILALFLFTTSCYNVYMVAPPNVDNVKIGHEGEAFGVPKNSKWVIYGAWGLANFNDNTSADMIGAQCEKVVIETEYSFLNWLAGYASRVLISLIPIIGSIISITSTPDFRTITVYCIPKKQ